MKPYILIWIFSAIAIYSITSFATWDFNAQHWGLATRLSISILWIAISTLICAFYEDVTKNK